MNTRKSQIFGNFGTELDPKSKKLSHSHIFYAKKDFLEHVPKPLVPHGPVKIGEPGGYYGPTPRHIPHDELRHGFQDVQVDLTPGKVVALKNTLDIY